MRLPTASRRSRILRACLALGAVAVASASPARGQVVERMAEPGVAAPTMTRDAAGVATVRAMRIDGEFALDGRLTEAVYTSMQPYTDFVQQEPHEGELATEKTEVWLFFDDVNIYIGARLHETDSSRRVMSEMRRDSFNSFNNDHLAVLFDTFYDRRNGFGFAANRLGGMFDWSATNEQPSPNWNGLWASQATDFDGGWNDRDPHSLPLDPVQGRQRDVGGQLPPDGAVEERDLVPQRRAAVVGPPRLEQAVERGHPGRARDAEEEPQYRRQALRPGFGADRPAGGAGVLEPRRRQLRRRRQVGHHPATGR